MKQIFYLTVFLLYVFSVKVTAQDNSFFSKGEKSANIHHVGDVWLKEISSADSIFNSSIAIAKFGTGARLDWHKRSSSKRARRMAPKP